MGRCKGNGFRATESAGSISAQPCAHRVLQVSRPPLLLCQAEVSPALLLSAVSVLLSAPGRTGWGALSNNYTKTEQFPAEIEGCLY